MTAPGASNPATARLEHQAAVAAVVAGVALMAVKFVAWRLTGSSAVYSDAMESIVNVAASGFAFWAVWNAHRPADRTHPYGHGKFEFISATVEGALIAGAAVTIVWQACHRLVEGGRSLENVDLGLWLVGGTVVVNGALGLWLMGLGRRTGSVALGGDGRHLLTDAATSCAAIGALLVVRTTGAEWVDPVVALGMAAVILVVGYRMVRRALGDLVDEQDPHDYAAVGAILDAHVEGRPGARAPFIQSWHKLRTRHLGRHHWVDFHIQLPGTMDVATAHEIASQIELEIEQHLGGGQEGGNATAHIEPAAKEAR
ncbi:MAG: cation diffusion facilitator family transporter [Phycisphaerales bacterium]